MAAGLGSLARVRGWLGGSPRTFRAIMAWAKEWRLQARINADRRPYATAWHATAVWGRVR